MIIFFGLIVNYCSISDSSCSVLTGIEYNIRQYFCNEHLPAIDIRQTLLNEIIYHDKFMIK